MIIMFFEKKPQKFQSFIARDLQIDKNILTIHLKPNNLDLEDDILEYNLNEIENIWVRH